jgi:TonB-dependent SusC/RagA subfamily outer membrane receptor
MRSKFLFTAFFCTLIFSPYLLFAQEEAIIKGKVTDESGAPLPGANVIIQLTNMGAAADRNGNYQFIVPSKSVRGQEVKMEARFIGYRSKTEKIFLTPGTISQDFALSDDVLAMDAIIVTGVVDETPRTKMAFSVGSVNREQLEQVPSVSAESALRGKVAGVKVIRGSGEPGSAASLLLRGPISINASGRSQDPLYIIDGVIIDPSISGSPLADINAEDIESIDVVKGAAGASLYGARAANGVVNIKTTRGKSMALNQTRISVRNEFGVSGLQRKIALPKHHPFKIHDGSDSYVDANGIKVTPGDFIDSDGDFIDPRQGSRDYDRYSDAPQGSEIYFADKPYKWIATGDIPIDPDSKLPIIDPATGQPVGLRLLPDGQLFDQMARFFDPGQFISNSVSISRNMENINFSFTLSNYLQDGVITVLNGFDRKSLRFALDHTFHKDFILSMTGYFSLTDRDDIDSGPFNNLPLMGKDADLTARHVTEVQFADGSTMPIQATVEFPDGIPHDIAGELFIRPDPNVLFENPLYPLERNERENNRNRTMGSLSLSYQGFDWFDIGVNLSYDRSSRELNLFAPIGYQTSGLSDGFISTELSADEALNGNLTASFRRAFLSNDLTVRAKARALFESTEFQNNYAEGTGLAVRGVKTLSNADQGIGIASQLQRVRSEGYSFIAGFDFKDRYIADFLVRWDGSSLFGTDERWHNYSRISGAYRLSQESWWFTDKIQEFKVRASYGTAGGRPNFSARYETWQLAAGNVSKENLGNKRLKPEFAKELEIGLDVSFLDKFSLELTRAKSTVEDQILFVPLASYFGYQRQWQNAGTLETSTWEASLQAAVIQRRDVRWSFGFNLDRTRQRIARLNIPPYQFGVWNLLRIEEGEEFGALYGISIIRDVNELLLQGVTANELNQFQVNDDGYVVWVGEGNTFKDGINEELWGLRSDNGDHFTLLPGGTTTTNSRTYMWGYPIYWQDETGNENTKIGSVVPDFNLSISTNFQWQGFSAYALLDAQIGGDVFNLTRWLGMRTGNAGEFDQAGKSDELKKPVLYNVPIASSRNSHFVESSEYLKVRELSLRYTFNRSQLRRLFGGILNKVTIGVVGRNLFTFTGYTGYDPEVGLTGGDVGSAVVNRLDLNTYPNFRTFTGVLEFEF